VAFRAFKFIGKINLAFCFSFSIFDFSIVIFQFPKLLLKWPWAMTYKK